MYVKFILLNFEFFLEEELSEINASALPSFCYHPHFAVAKKHGNFENWVKAVILQVRKREANAY